MFCSKEVKDCQMSLNFFVWYVCHKVFPTLSTGLSHGYLAVHWVGVWDRLEISWHKFNPLFCLRSSNVCTSPKWKLTISQFCILQYPLMLQTLHLFHQQLWPILQYLFKLKCHMQDKIQLCGFWYLSVWAYQNKS